MILRGGVNYIIYIFVWNHKEASQLTTALAKWLVPM